MRFSTWLKTENRQLILNYLQLRRAIGILGMSLPVILLIGYPVLSGKREILSSVSAYYYTCMGDVFVGILWATGLFLYAYKGHNPVDNYLSTFAGFCAVAIACFPCTPDPDTAPCLYHAYDTVHLIASIGFFACLMYISAFQFTKSDQKVLSKKTKRRNRWFVTFAVIMLISLLGIFFIKTFTSGLDNYHPEFWLELIALFAFGLSWILKGIYYEKEEYIQNL
jgi:hypothetical protein